MSEKIELEGTIENIVFSNLENGYHIFTLHSEKYPKIFSDGEIICVGYMPKINVGEYVKVLGSVITHATYGKQLQIEKYEKTVPKTKVAIEMYLASGFLKGVGKKLAKKIVEKFGENTLSVIEKTPEKLSIINGISQNKAMELGKIYLEQTEFVNVILFLQKYGISPSLATKIYNQYKANTVKMLEDNPYRLADDIFGISFGIADNIAEKLGIEKDSPYRIKSAIRHVLNKRAMLFGDTYLTEDKLIEDVVNLLQIDEEIIINNLSGLQMERQICIEKIGDNNIIFLNLYYYAENYVAKKLLELSKNKKKYKKEYDSWLADIESREDITFATGQTQAIKDAMINGVLVITGGPGTGKTTIINAIISMLKKEGYEIELCAPTGRASKKMSEMTGLEAQTIHRLLEISFLSVDKRSQTFEKNEEMPIETDVIIVDECSMVDILLMNSFLKAVANGTRLILVGDVDQLPSVGAGNVLKDIIDSGYIAVSKLNEIFRQARESAIVMNAHKINNGVYPILNEKNKDFFFIKKYNMEDINDTIIELITKRLPKFLNISDIKMIQVLSPIKKTQIGIINLNNILQNAINPPDKEKQEKEFRKIIFREGDKVMQVKNNYNMAWKTIKNNIVIDEGLGIFNGDEGVITEVNNAREYVEVIFDDSKYIKYDFTQLDELDLAYAITIHKSQGSEYKAIIIPMPISTYGRNMFLTRNLLYTAVTRATDMVVIVGIPDVLNQMVDNNNELSRHTYLKNRIEYLSKFMEDSLW